MKCKSWMSGLKWANISKFLITLAWKLDLEIKIIEKDKGILKETVYFEIEGEEKDKDLFKKTVYETVEKYNK